MTATVGFAEISTHIIIENIIAEIKEQYLADDTPWIVGFSGVPVELVEQLLQIEKDKSGLMRRNNLFKDIDMALKNYLKTQEVSSLYC